MIVESIDQLWRDVYVKWNRRAIVTALVYNAVLWRPVGGFEIPVVVERVAGDTFELAIFWAIMLYILPLFCAADRL